MFREGTGGGFMGRRVEHRRGGARKKRGSISKGGGGPPRGSEHRVHTISSSSGLVVVG